MRIIDARAHITLGWEELGIVHRRAQGVPVPAYEGVAALGGELLFPEAHQPMIRDQGQILATPEAIDTLQVPDPRQGEWFQHHVETWQTLCRRFPGQRISRQRAPRDDAHGAVKIPSSTPIDERQGG